MPAQPQDSEPHPRWVPPFLREIKAHSQEVGLINATHNLLRRDNINVEVTGDFNRLKEHPGGILFVGDHKNQWEFVGIMDMLSQMGRHDMRNIVKFYVQKQVIQALGHKAAKLTLPVYPRLLARDRGEFFNSETLNRIRYRRSILTLAESKQANTNTSLAATEYLEKGGAVNIFPCGGVVDARTHPWRPGVGRIIQQIPDEVKGDVLIAPYAMAKISRTRLVAAVALRGKGIAGRPQTMSMQLLPMHTAEELVDALPAESHDDPEAITELLRQRFLEQVRTS